MLNLTHLQNVTKPALIIVINVIFFKNRIFCIKKVSGNNKDPTLREDTCHR